MQLPSQEGIQSWQPCTNLSYKKILFLRDKVTGFDSFLLTQTHAQSRDRQYLPLFKERWNTDSIFMFRIVLGAGKGFHSLLSLTPCSTGVSSVPSTIPQLDCRAHKSMTMLWRDEWCQSWAESRRHQLAVEFKFLYSLSPSPTFNCWICLDVCHTGKKTLSWLDTQEVGCQVLMSSWLP